MAKSVEQRTKELDIRVYLVASWTERTAAYKKELDAPIFKKLGDVAGLAKRYDAATDNFIKFDTSKDDAKNLFTDGATAVGKIDKLGEGLIKEQADLVKEGRSTLSLVKDATKIEDRLNNWEEVLKGQQDVNKERKAVFDRIMKLGDDRLKAITDVIGKVRKEVDAAKAGLTSTNNELNTLEAQIRSAIVNYQKTAIDMDKKEIADAVRGFLGVFGRS